jgi:hypothetical protein
MAVIMACLAGPAGAGSISYEWHNVMLASPGGGSLVIDYPDPGMPDPPHVQSFLFNIFTTADLHGLSDPLVASHAFGGQSYMLTVDFGPASFVPGPSSFWHVSTVGSQGTYGYGYWTSQSLTSASIPEPSALILACMAIACITIWRTKGGRP